MYIRETTFAYLISLAMDTFGHLTRSLCLPMYYFCQQCCDATNNKKQSIVLLCVPTGLPWYSRTNGTCRSHGKCYTTRSQSCCPSKNKPIAGSENMVTCLRRCRPHSQHVILAILACASVGHVFVSGQHWLQGTQGPAWGSKGA